MLNTTCAFQAGHQALPQLPQGRACTGDAPTRICRTEEEADLLENTPITETNRSKKIDYL